MTKGLTKLLSRVAFRASSSEVAGVRRSSAGPDELDSLTEREREVLVLIADGFSNKQIATRLDVGVRTVETHREHIMRKLNIHSIAGLTRYAIAKGLVKLA